jgi:hypothetical protein
MRAEGFETSSHRAFVPDFRGKEPAFPTVRDILPERLEDHRARLDAAPKP